VTNKTPKTVAAKASKKVKKSDGRARRGTAPRDTAEAAAGDDELAPDPAGEEVEAGDGTGADEAYDPEVLDSSGSLGDEEENEDLERDELGGDEQDTESRSELDDDARDEPEARGGAVSRFDPLSAYMREVQSHALLSPEEEHSLAVSYQKNPDDVEAAARLVTANLRLVVKIAYEYRRAYKNMMDLIQEGNIGLMQAVKKFDPYRGVKLSSYAAWWIRAYMLRFILNNWRLVKLGTTQAQRKLFFNLSKEKARLSALGIEPTDAEIAKRLNVTEGEVAEMDKRLARSDASLDASVGESDGRTVSRIELMPSPGSTPDQLAEGAELSELLVDRLDEFRKGLTGKDVVIFDKRLVADEPLTLQELGDEFGVSRERVRQLEARLTGKLRDYLKQTLGDAVELG
jgi:RNA polymerase sigma-32 factor